MERESERGISENVIINIEPVDGVDSYRLQDNYESHLSNGSNTALMPWIIPRPTLVKPDNINDITVENLLKHGTIYPSNLLLALPSPTNEKLNSCSSSTTSSSTSSSKSANSNTLLLTAANLAAFKFDNVTPHHEYVATNGKNYDTESLASSTHFTLVNGMERKLPKHMKPVECCCERHQLSILITTMTLVFSLTIFLCIYFVHAKAQEDHVRWS